MVEYTDAKGLPRKICIECKDRCKPQYVMWIEQLQQKREDIGLDYFRTDYPNDLYGNGTLTTSDCGITCLAMVESYMTGRSSITINKIDLTATTQHYYCDNIKSEKYP